MTKVTLCGITDYLSPENERYGEALLVAAQCFRDAEAMFNDPNFDAKRGWKKEDEASDGEAVYCKHVSQGKYCTVSTVFEGDVNNIFNLVWTAIPELPEWNKHINYSSTAATLTPYCDILTYGSNDIFVVSGRDFVSARIFRPLPGGGYLMVARSFVHEDFPQLKGKVRAHLHMAAARFRPHSSAPGRKTTCDVLMMADLKGLLPKFLVERMMPKVMVMDTEMNKKHWKEVVEKQRAGTK